MIERTEVELAGTITRWDGNSGDILTDRGERISFNRLQLQLSDIAKQPKIGDRIFFSATCCVEVKHELEAVRKLIAKEPNEAELRYLALLNRAREEQRHPDNLAVDLDFTGTIESYDASKGYGFITADTGDRVLVHATCLRAAGHRSAEPGSTVFFSALLRRGGLQAYRIHQLQPPAQH